MSEKTLRFPTKHEAQFAAEGLRRGNKTQWHVFHARCGSESFYTVGRNSNEARAHAAKALGIVVSPCDEEKPLEFLAALTPEQIRSFRDTCNLLLGE